MRPIDADLLELDTEWSEYTDGFTSYSQFQIDNAPTIEVKPIIYCKDCAFWESKRVSCEGLARCKTGESGYRCRFGHDFCSRAQRREEVSEDAR